MGLKENLPLFIAEEKYTQEILDAIEPEIEKIKIMLFEALLECCVTTASTKGVRRFEKDYSIKYDAELSLSDRKRQIINKMLARKILTKENLANLVKRNIEDGQFYIANLAEEYKFRVMITDANYEEKLYKILYEARPANLIFDIILVSYERRCGAFGCNCQYPV